MEKLLKDYHMHTVEILHFLTDIQNDFPWEGEMWNMEF